MKTKTVKNYTYDGLGFPVILKEVKMEQVMGVWAPIIDIEYIAQKTIKKLITQDSRLTGNQIKFIRQYFSMSLRDFAEQVVSESHTAVAKWEKRGNEITKMDINIEKILRLYIYTRTSKNTDKRMNEIIDNQYSTKEHALAIG
ncbi:hypothetical protein L3V79_08965 [Thiotrichales bacterium 19S9-12]|nr:hypothetical protein [Thiotrichales bacterium 19S9-11]MCF6812487.1 hypothetical protein [Thiotrichales bacterium 19S9-12]